MRLDAIHKNKFAERYEMTQIALGNKKTGSTEQAGASGLAEAENPAEDIVDISSEAKQNAREAQRESQDMAGQYQAVLSQLEKACEQGNAVGDAMTVRIKCLRIAMRIISGNKVPSEDHRYLAKNDPELYAKAITMKVEKKDPKEYDRLSEDEEEGVKEGTDGSKEALTQSASLELPVETEAAPEIET